jgi:hypothetical protein
VDGAWWLSWSSKPLWGGAPVPGEFDSHTLPPILILLSLYFIFLKVVPKETKEKDDKMKKTGEHHKKAQRNFTNPESRIMLISAKRL